MPPKRIAIVSPVPTHPFRAGNSARVLRLVTDLRDLGHEVHLIFVDDVPGDLETMRVLLDGRLHVVTNPRPPFRNPWPVRLLDRLARATGGPMQVQLLTDADAFLSEPLRRRTAEIARAIDPDLAVAIYPFYAGLLDAFPARTRRILDVQDRFSGRHWTFWRYGPRVRFVSLARRHGADVRTLGHRVELERRPLPDADAPLRVGHLAGAHEMNLRSLNWLIERVLPRLRRRFPGLELHVAGTVGICPDLRRAPGVRVLGRVDDLAKFFERVHVFVNPAWAGTGLHVRNLEALACARPTVMHRAAVRGLRAGAGTAFLTARTARGFERQIARVLESRPLAQRLSDAAHHFARAYDARVEAQLRSIFGPA